MDARLSKKRRSSRWTRDPVLDDGEAVIVYPTDRDIEIFKLLTRYRYCPAIISTPLSAAASKD